jgi:DNA-binding protein Fis
VLLPDFLPASLRIPESARPATPGATFAALEEYIAQRLRAGPSDLYDGLVREVKQRLLKAALEHTDGNQVQAARLLGLSRSTFRNELRGHGITVERSVSTPDRQ